MSKFGSDMLLRIRTQVGTWRVGGISAGDTLEAVKHKVELEHRTVFLPGKPMSRDPAGKDILPFSSTVGSLGLKNGDMIYATVDEEKTGVHEDTTISRFITKDGNIMAKEYAKGSHNGFRPGMMALKSMKMQWTLNDFLEMDEKYVYRVKNRENVSETCSKVFLDDASITGKHLSIFVFSACLN